jgi:hypothetical protein
MMPASYDAFASAIVHTINMQCSVSAGLLWCFSGRKSL